MRSDAELSKLSVAELRKQIFWCGASLPSGHLEKSDLVAALRKHFVEGEQREAAKLAQKRQVHAGVPRPEPKPLNYDHKAPKEQQETVDLHILPEEELKRRIVAAGEEVPEGEVGKFWLVATLRNALRRQELLEKHLAEQVQAVSEADAATAMATLAAAGSAQAAQAACLGAVQVEAAAPSQPCRDMDADDLDDVFDDRDPSELSAKELRQRLRAYKARGEEKLRGLTEKHEFVTALREAMADWGLPQPRRPRQATRNGIGQVDCHPCPCEAEAQHQDAELKVHLDAEVVASMECDNVKSVEQEKILTKISHRLHDDGKSVADSVEAEADVGKTGSYNADSGGGASLSRTVVRCNADARFVKKRSMTCEVVVSDEEDEVCAISATPISLDAEDVEVCAVSPVVAKSAKRLRQIGDGSNSTDSEVVRVNQDAVGNVSTGMWL